ncbi:MAG: DUF6524 family protein [Steroidobacteraceae bacterium]
MQNLSFGGVALRFLASLVLVIATYNPTGHSYIHWISGSLPHLEPVQVGSVSPAKAPSPGSPTSAHPPARARCISRQRNTPRIFAGCCTP